MDIANRHADDRLSLPIKRYLALDAIRGLLALSVAVGHYTHWLSTNSRFPGSFILAVDFFFVLSGFVLANSLFSSRDKSKWALEFPIKRVMRLFPLYLICLIVTCGVIFPAIGVDYLREGPHTLVNWLLLLQGIGVGNIDVMGTTSSAMGIAWAVSVELWIAVIMFMTVSALHNRVQALVILLSSLAFISATVLTTYSPNYMDVHYHRFGPITFGMIRGALGFSLGVLCYLVSLRIKRINYSSAYEAILLVLAFVLYGNFEYDRQMDYLAPILFFAMVLVYSKGGGYISKLLEVKPLVLLGNCSFGVYLIHPMLIDLFKAFGLAVSWGSIAAYILSVILLAYLAYRFVERPGIILGVRAARAFSSN